MVNNFNYMTCPKCSHDRNALTAQKCEICGTKLGKGKGLLPLVVASVGIIALIGAGSFGYRAFTQTAQSSTGATAQANTNTGSATLLDSQSPAVMSGDASVYLSEGEKILFANSSNPDKQAATSAIASGDFATAVSKLESARQSLRNDPETLIYLNNARLGNTAALTIAVVVPISSSASSAQELLRGVAQAQDEAIQAGVPLKVLIGDDNNDPNQAMMIANALVQSNALAVIGHGTSRTSLAAAPIYQENGLVMISPTSTSTELAQIPRGANGNFIFRTVASDQFTGTTLARHALSQGLSKAVVFYNSTSSYSKSLQEAFSTTLSLEGGQVVQQIDLSQGNAAAQLAQVDADVVALFPDSETLPQALEVAKINQNQLPVLAGDAFYRIESLQQAGSALNGAVLPVPWHPLRSSDPNFASKGANLWGGDVNWRTALSYDAFQVVRQARSVANVTPQSGVQGRLMLEQALSGSSFSSNGVTGAISFLPSGDRNSQVTLVKVEPGSRSGTGFDFIPF